MPRGKKPQKLAVKTRVTTGTAVALLFFAASVAFAAAAYTQLDVKLGIGSASKTPANDWKDPRQAGLHSPKKTPSQSAHTQTSSLTMALDDDTPHLSVAVGGSQSVPVLKVRFVATGEPFVVKKIRVLNNNNVNDTAINQLKLSYPTRTGSLETKNSLLVNGVADFQDVDFFVQQNTPVVLTVLADISEITGPDMSGDSPQFAIDFDTNIEALGVSSGLQLTSIGAEDVVGNQLVIHKTKPVVALAPSSPAGPNVPGNSEVLRFLVSADPKGDLVVNQLGFKINATDNASSGWSTGRKLLPSAFSLFDATKPIERIDCTWSVYGASGFVEPGIDEPVGYAVCALNQPHLVAAGSTKTFALKMDTSGASLDARDTIRVDIPDTQAGASVVSFGWGEVGIGAMSYIDGTGVRNLPIIGNVIRY